MKCFFAFSGKDSKYIEMAKVLVRSAKANTNLKLFCIFDGEDKDFTRWLGSQGVSILKWQVSFLDDLIMEYTGERSIEFCRGTYLCMELPKILYEYGVMDEYVLYVDTDIMFTGPIQLKRYKPNYLASSSDWGQDDWSRFSTGVIVMNVPNLLRRYPDFLAHLRKNKFDFSYTKMGPCDQGAWNTFYATHEHDKLNPLYDWKPWWGINPDARIVHFSGPKPQEVRHLMGIDVLLNEKDRLQHFVISENPGAYEYYTGVWDGYLGGDLSHV